MNDLQQRPGESTLEYFKRLRPTAKARYAKQQRHSAYMDMFGDVFGFSVVLGLIVMGLFLCYSLLTANM